MQGASFANLERFVFGLTTRKFAVELQTDLADCGFVCCSAAATLLGRPTRVQDVKDRAGSASRGLTIRQLRDVCRSNGLKSDAIAFDPPRIDQVPLPAIFLLKSGHYVLGTEWSGSRKLIQIYDPNTGWRVERRDALRRKATQLAIVIDRSKTARTPSLRSGGASARRQPFSLRQLLKRRDARKALILLALAQVAALSVPLVAMTTVNKQVSLPRSSFLGAAIVIFGVISMLSGFITPYVDAVSDRFRRRVTVDASRWLFVAIREKPAEWITAKTPASLKSMIDSFQVEILYHVSVVQAVAGIGVGLVLGIGVLAILSPWLALPGLITLLASSFVEVAVSRHQQSGAFAALEAIQKKQRFVLDVLVQMPALLRFGATAKAGRRFATLTRVASQAESRLAAYASFKGAVVGALKSGETVIFAVVSAHFWSKGHLSLGAFAALGVYKDLLSQNMNALLQLHVRRRSIKVHQLQADAFAGGAPCPPSDSEAMANTGVVNVTGLRFRYGSLDEYVVDGLDLHVERGETIAILGGSGVGKSTLAKVLVGTAAIKEGAATIGGEPAGLANPHIASVLQTDRLIEGDVADNVMFFRDGFTLHDVNDALQAACALDFVLSLPMKHKTVLSEGTSVISGGQKQRILLARALLGRPRILLLDEATSSLEVDVERTIIQGLKERGATLLLIAHRPEVWALADRVLEFTPSGMLPIHPAGLPNGVAPAGIVGPHHSTVNTTPPPSSGDDMGVASRIV